MISRSPHAFRDDTVMRRGVFIQYDGDDEALESIISQKLSTFYQNSKHDEDFVDDEEEYHNHFNC